MRDKGGGVESDALFVYVVQRLRRVLKWKVGPCQDRSIHLDEVNQILEPVCTRVSDSIVSWKALAWATGVNGRARAWYQAETLEFTGPDYLILHRQGVQTVIRQRYPVMVVARSG